PKVAEWGCDFVACSAYKFYGPHLGVLWGRPPLLDRLKPPHLEPAGPSLETGTLNHEGIAGAAAAIEFLAGGRGRAGLEATYASLEDHGQGLLERLWEGLSELSGVRLFGPGPQARRTPTVAFTVEGLSSRQVAARLAEQAVFVSHGDFYATTVARRLGQADQGLVRAGCACYTSQDEVDRLIRGVASLRAHFS
ncbi:MAG: aminotransferase class V-fold PLP-dependent enzyme, partial [Candidatus Eremiobacteraeota bacterium]|nr:aminotransferase class V-fold PLP-dependent enzyme [Candidatus Eremiobacteraeota bacterium]